MRVWGRQLIRPRRWGQKRGGGGMRDHKREQVDSSSKFGDIKAKQTSGFNPEVELKHAVTD